MYLRASGSNTREGPFTVGLRTEAGNYTLLDDNDNRVKEDQEINESDLEAV